MTARRLQHSKGVSLIEIMIAIAVIQVAIVGTSAYRYYSILDTHKATARITAARITLLFCENWRGVKGAEDYDPATYSDVGLTITTGSGPDAPEEFTSLGSYTVISNGFTYYATLSWKDVDTELRALNVIVAWAQKFQGQGGFENTDKTFELRTYAYRPN